MPLLPRSGQGLSTPSDIGRQPQLLPFTITSSDAPSSVSAHLERIRAKERGQVWGLEALEAAGKTQPTVRPLSVRQRVRGDAGVERPKRVGGHLLVPRPLSLSRIASLGAVELSSNYRCSRNAKVAVAARTTSPFFGATCYLCISIGLRGNTEH